MVARWVHLPAVPAVVTALLLVVLFSPSPARAAVWRVAPGAPGPAQDGTIWAHAFRTVQAGLDAAGPGDEVWVAAGIYVENLRVPPGVRLLGGFSGTETTRDQRDHAANATILDGGMNGAVVTVAPGAGQDTLVDGFTIRNGSGGGIWLEASAPTVSHNVILSNAAGYVRISAQMRVSLGGGILIRDASPIVRNNVVMGNGARYGGGVGVFGAAAPHLVNNTIVTNSAGDGGGLAALEGARFTLMNNLIARNASGLFADTGGAALAVRHNLLYGNAGYEARGLPDPTGRDGNLRTDPRLANLPFGDWHIQPDSPARDAGDGSAVAPGEQDLDGQPRIIAPPFAPGRSRTVCGRVDIGADESDGRLSPSGPPAVVRVSTQGDDRRSGQSWASAKRTVQAAVDAVAVRGGGEVWVAGGLYTESISVPPNVYLYGGFAGRDPIRNRGWSGETYRFGRDIGANPTVLDGGARTGIAIPPVVTLDGRGGGSGLDGFTVRNAGYSIVPPKNLPRFGPAVRVTGTVTLANNMILNNPGDGIRGTQAMATLTGNTVVGNTTVANNAAEAPEGGISFSQSTVVMEHNTIAANGTGASLARSCAGILLRDGALSLVRNTVVGNGGGGISAINAYGLVRGNVLKGNTGLADGNTPSGGLYAVGSKLAVVNNTFVGNAPAGLGFTSDMGSTVVNNLIADNWAGTRIEGTMPEFRYNAFYGNTTAPNGTPGTDNIMTDPKIASVRYGDVHLQPDSPLIDCGDPSLADLGQSDMDGQPRLLGARVDIGADESDGTAWPEGPRIVRVAPGGNDAQTGASWTQAKATVNGAMVALADSGDDVWIAAGLYPERVILNRYASLYGGFTGAEAEREERDWMRNASVLDGGGGYATVVTVLSGGRENRVDGLTIRNGGSSANFGPGPGGGVTLYAPITLAHNLITGNRFGAVVCWGASPLVTQNRIVDNPSMGIYALSTSGTVSNNLIARNSMGVGCRLCTGFTVINNTIVQNRSGVGFDQENQASFTNNIVAFNGSFGFTASPWYRIGGPLSYNDVYGNAEGNWNGIDKPGPNNLAVDPLFAGAAAADFHLTAASPLIDRGLNLSAQIGAEDLDGAPRVRGPRVDIGAYEFPQ